MSLLALPALAGQGVRVAVIIDDLGNSLKLGQRALDLPAAVTYSILPHRPYNQEIADRANRKDREVMLHLPMEAKRKRSLGAGGLYSHMPRDEFTRVLQAGIASVPHMVGVNNHMGSLLTSQPEVMRWLMHDLACFGPLYFVDSRTTAHSVALDFAKQAGLSNAVRDVFLDHDPAPGEIREQFHRMVQVARRKGQAIVIAHPYPETLAVLEEVLPTLKSQGIEVVPVSELVDQERKKETWLACSSPLPTVAKNSKP